jgi:signal transduction protein with GAF and PtsI domain
MGKSAEENFIEYIAPRMEKLFKKYSESKETENLFDSFKNILKDLDSTRLKRELLCAILDSYRDNDAVETVIADCFSTLYEYLDLKKIQYSSGSTLVNVDYGVVFDE